MANRMTKRAVRREQVREQRARVSGTWRARLASRVLSWPVAVGAIFIVAASVVALLGETTLDYSVGQLIDHPIYAQVEFQVPDPEQTRLARTAARAATPSYYTLNKPALTFDRIRKDLLRLHQFAVENETFEAYAAAVESVGWLADENAYDQLRSMIDDEGRARFQQWISAMPLETEYVVRDLNAEVRTPPGSTSIIRLETINTDGKPLNKEIGRDDLVPQTGEKALSRSAAYLVEKFPYELRTTAKAIVLATLEEQPTIVYDQKRTLAEMQRAAEETGEKHFHYERGEAVIHPHPPGDDEGLTRPEYELLNAHHVAYLEFLRNAAPRARLLQRAGLVVLVTLVSIGLLAYTGLHQRRALEVGSRTVAFMVLMLGTLFAARMLDLKWPQIPELVYAPCLLAGSVLAIVYPRRFAMGVMCIAAVLVCTIVGGNLIFLLTLFTGVVVAVFQLDEIRSRTKLITSGAITALAIMITSTAGGLWQGHPAEFIGQHALWAGACALLASFVVSGILPLIERLFRVATSLALLEWRDPTRPLLQLLARDAPGTYNHSLMIGTLAEAACESIGANGLLAQVGALYHDIGKIQKADYFTENQEGQVSRHDKLAPTMSLLIILGHVKDGVEMAKEYKLPRVLHQFIEEHHGTTVIRYFHYVASEKQPLIASGKHDREVPEAEFRYGGPKPRTRESAVLMLCDGVEGAVRALPEPTPNRIESVVHQVVTNRLNDGQFDDCDITLKEIRQVNDSLVKNLCSIYHGRVAYPKAQKPTLEEPSELERSEPPPSSGPRIPARRDAG